MKFDQYFGIQEWNMPDRFKVYKETRKTKKRYSSFDWIWNLITGRWR